MASVLKRLLRSGTTQAVHEIRSGPFDIKILGDVGFVATVRSALDLIEEGCPDLYQIVVGHVAAIESLGQGAGRHHEEPPTVGLESSIGYGRDLSPRSMVVWYAGEIVHEAWHSKLYREHRLETPAAPWPVDEWSAVEREDACLQVQHEALLRLGAPQWMLDYVRSMIGVGHQGIPDRAW